MSNKILVVEDDALSQFVIVEMCKELGFECLTADDGAEALDLIAQNATDIKLVLMDIHMPKVSGLDATGAIRSTSEDPPKNLPVIATTADSNWHDLQRCHEHGFQFHDASHEWAILNQHKVVRNYNASMPDNHA